MAIEILRRGSEGKNVERWQHFLIGQKFLKGLADGEFGPMTEQATKAFQRASKISADGIVGPKAFGKALELGFDIGFTDPQLRDSEPLLPITSSLKALNGAKREQLFGKIEFKAESGGKIKILNNWEQDNIKTVILPQLKGIPVFGPDGRKSSGKLRFHQAAGEQLKALWSAWEEEGLIDRILSYEGSYNPRFIRGSRTSLSNHAYGTAFDINGSWNGLGKIPASSGERGSVRELIALANEYGFYWGGHFKSRPDGMHFEVAKLL
ncbi:MAG: M15 family metallopeptidase [Motiliproteus sp.]